MVYTFCPVEEIVLCHKVTKIFSYIFSKVLSFMHQPLNLLELTVVYR